MSENEDRYYWHNVQVTQVHGSVIGNRELDGTTGDDFYLSGTSDEEIETALEKHMEGLRKQLRESRVERATIWIHDYTDDPEGETIITEEFSESYDDNDFEVTEQQAEAALLERDADLTLCGRDTYNNHFWKIGRWVDEAHMTYVDVIHFSTLAEVVAWAEDDENFKYEDEDEDEDA